MAEIISSHGNPLLSSVSHRGGAETTDREGSSGDNNNIRENNNTTNYTNKEFRYQRPQTEDARLWREYRKRKLNPSDTPSAETENHTDATVDRSILEIEEEADRTYYNRWHVPRLGTMTEHRPDGVYRLMGAQLNSISSADRRDKKVAEIERIIDTWDVQGGCFQEVGINWSAVGYERNMTSWFRLDRRETRTNTAHNTHENIEVAQQGGVAQFMCKELVTFAHETESDFRGLGRWTSWLLYANSSHKTRVVTAYNLGIRKSNYLSTIYQQHLRFIQLQGWNITPHRLFMIDFLAAIMRWSKAGERLIIFADMNEHILQGQLATRLLSLGLVEALHNSWDTYEPHTHVSGSKPIDGIYHSSNLEITSSMMLSFHEGVGDHRTLLVDITARSLLGTDGFKIVRPAARRLTCTNKKSVEQFNKYVEAQITQHNLHNRLVTASYILQRNPSDNLGLEMMEVIDKQTTEILTAGERQCRKITDRPLQFSAPVAYWVHRRWAYQGLLRIAQGKCKNLGNARRRAKKAGLDKHTLTVEQCAVGIRVCDNHLKQLKSQAIGLRKVHLRNCLIVAEDLRDKEKCKDILRVIEREEQKAMWGAIRRATDDPRLGAITFVQRETPDGTVNITDMDGMCEEIQTVTERRFELAESAPVTTTSLRHSVGFLADTQFALEMVSRKARIPDDVENTTKLVIEEMQRLWDTKGQERFNAFEITSDDYKSFWKRVKESTSSSISGVHFGVYKAAISSNLISSFLADKLTVIGSYGCPPSRWGCGLQVMLEKIAGVALVNKLRAILLMEGDYNFFNKFVFGYKALNVLYENEYIPQDQYSQRESTAEDARLENRLTMDISRQLHIPLAAVSVDADKCYDRINHIMMSLVLLSVVGAGGLVTALLHPIQTMKFFQRTAWGDSNTFMGGRTADNPLQGLCQGNGAAPACWLMLSSLLMHCYSRQGFGSSILSPMSLIFINFLGQMYVDDTDLIVMQPHYRPSSDIRKDTQASVDAWTHLLISTGGSLNPDKCYWYMVDYVCIDGEWNYAPTIDWELTIPLPDGTRHPITQLEPHASKKMPGVWSNPAGKDETHLRNHIHNKYLTWVNRTINGHLPSRWNWISYRFKLFPGIRYGLATLATTTAQVQSILNRIDYAALPVLGVSRSIKREWRSIPRAFGGIGLFDLAVEQMTGWANMILQHFGAPTTLGLKCKATLEALQLEIGCKGNPLTEDFASRGILATPTWITSVWERTHLYNLKFHLSYSTLPLQRENDIDIISLLLQNGISGMELRRMNRCRLKLEAIFLSDITTAGGRQLEPWVLSTHEGRHSNFNFPHEQPSVRDWALWDSFWKGWLRRDKSIPIPLGRWVSKSHQVWQWFLDETSNLLWECTSDGWVQYEFQQTARHTRGNRSYYPSRCWKHIIEINNLTPVSTKMDFPIAHIIDLGPSLAETQETNYTFWQFVEAQGGEWMWEFVEGKHDDMEWLVTALRNKTAIMVTDGSFNRGLTPNISGAGWVLVCTSSRKMVRGCFHEESEKASSYRGELLGLTAIHHLVGFALDFYQYQTATGSMHCDNKGALRQASHKRRRVRTGTKHADLIRNLRYIKGKYRFEVTYLHVKAHQDDVTAYEDLPLVEQLNVMCDLLAKQAVQRAYERATPRLAELQLLPNEQAALIVENSKQTTDVASALRFSLGMKKARQFFTKPRRIQGETNIGGLGWTKDRFDCIEWEALRDVLATKPDMYGIWLAKQTIGACATRRVIALRGGTSDDRCPNCLTGPERSDHLNLCRDPGRSHLFEADVRELGSWMSKSTDTEFSFWFINYLLLRGEYTMEQLGSMSTSMSEIATDIDKIGWVDILHGRLPRSVLRFQLSFCALTNSRMTGRDWIKRLITKLLNISHAQWAYRNFSLHNKLNGHLQLCRQEEVLTKIAELSSTPPEDIPEESRFLLEFESSSLDSSNLTQQEYWVTAMTAALTAGRRRAQPRRRPRNKSLSNPAPQSSPRQRRNEHLFRCRIDRLLHQLREDLDLTYGSWRTKRPRSAEDTLNGSDKRFRKPD